MPLQSNLEPPFNVDAMIAGALSELDGTHCTRKVITDYIEALKQGNFRAVAARAAGTQAQWMSQHMDRSICLQRLVDWAETVPETVLVDKLLEKAAGGNIYATVEYLRRRFRHRWGDSQAIRLEDLSDEDVMGLLTRTSEAGGGAAKNRTTR